MHGNSGHFPWGKRGAAIDDYGATQLFVFPCEQCFRVCTLLAVRPTLLWQMDMGSLMCTNIWTHAAHPKGVRRKQVCTQVDSEGQKKPSLPLPHQGIKPRVFGFEFGLSNHWAASHVTPSPITFTTSSPACYQRPFSPQAYRRIDTLPSTYLWLLITHSVSTVQSKC